MRGPYPGELRRRVIGFVEAGGSRREAAEQFDIGVSCAIRWMQRFREDGTCEPMPRGGSTSPLEEYAQQILALNREQPDLTLDEIVLALHKRRISGSRSALSRFFARHGITIKKKACAPQSETEKTWRGSADVGSASKGCLTPLALYLSMKLPSPSQRLEPARGTPYWRGSNGTLGNADIHRWLPQNRYRGPDADQGSYEWRSIPRLYRTMSRPYSPAQGHRRRRQRLLSQGDRRGGGNRGPRSRTAILAAVLARPQPNRIGVPSPEGVATQSGGAHSQRVGATRSLLHSRTQTSRMRRLFQALWL